MSVPEAASAGVQLDVQIAGENSARVTWPIRSMQLQHFFFFVFVGGIFHRCSDRDLAVCDVVLPAVVVGCVNASRRKRSSTSGFWACTIVYLSVD